MDTELVEEGNRITVDLYLFLIKSDTTELITIAEIAIIARCFFHLIRNQKIMRPAGMRRKGEDEPDRYLTEILTASPVTT